MTAAYRIELFSSPTLRGLPYYARVLDVVSGEELHRTAPAATPREARREARVWADGMLALLVLAGIATPDQLGLEQ